MIILSYKIKRLFISAIIVFILTWFVPSSLTENISYNSINILQFIIPITWSGIFAFLYSKNNFYIAFNAVFIFLLILIADRLNFGPMTIRSQFSYFSIVVLATFKLILFQNIFHQKPKIAFFFNIIINSFFIIIPVFYILYFFIFDVAISKEVFYAILQTNWGEAFEFSKDYISIRWISVVVLLFALNIFLFIAQNQKEFIIIKKSFSTILVLTFAFLSSFFIEDAKLYSYAKNTVDEYFTELALFKETQSKIESNNIDFFAEKDELQEIYLVVIGESLNKRHMGIYGYLRETTPHLNRIRKTDELLIFDNAFSTHTHTMPVLSLALTEANLLNGTNYYEALSIIDILNKTKNIDTLWITNQILYGAWDNLVSVIAKKANHLIAFNPYIGKQAKTKRYDGVLINEVEKQIIFNKRNKVMFVHLMGNHGNYCSRYPPGYQTFTKRLELSKFGKISKNESLLNSLNCYDNSVLYNDYVVSSLIKKIREKNRVGAVLYISDHADDVIGQVGHNSDKFTFPMTQIPMIMWLSNKYKKKYPEKYKTLKNNQSTLFPSDSLYDTIIGIIDLKTDRYNGTYDLSSIKYDFNETDAYTLHGGKKYTDNDNHSYHQKKNIDKIIKEAQGLRIIPHRVNSIGKLKDIWHSGFRAFEIDVLYRNNDLGFFEVGHNIGEMSGISLEEFIKSVPIKEIKKIWLDLKNLTPQNYKNIKKRLEYLDKQFNFKKKIIIELKPVENVFFELSKDGWHTSYYLPTKKILKLQKENKEQEMINLAMNICNQMSSQKLSAISFDVRIYKFAKNYLKPRFSSNIVFHTWDLSSKMFDKNIFLNLNKKQYYRDARIKTILLPYHSPYEL